AILSWLYTWNEFLFALILTGHNTALITVTMAQFVTELGTAWNLMSAMAELAMGPAVLHHLLPHEKPIPRLRSLEKPTTAEERRAGKGQQHLRRGAGRVGRRSCHARDRIRRTSRAGGMRQVDQVTHGCRARGPDLGPDPHRRARGQRPRSQGPRHPHGVPGSR